MKTEYYIVTDKQAPFYRLYYNENPESDGEEVMSKEDAQYTADYLGDCVIARLVIED